MQREREAEVRVEHCQTPVSAPHCHVTRAARACVLHGVRVHLHEEAEEVEFCQVPVEAVPRNIVASQVRCEAHEGASRVSQCRDCDGLPFCEQELRDEKRVALAELRVR